MLESRRMLGSPTREAALTDPPALAERFHGAAAQLDVAEDFAAVFRNDPEFLAPPRIVEELVAACPDLFT